MGGFSAVFIGGQDVLRCASLTQRPLRRKDQNLAPALALRHENTVAILKCHAARVCVCACVCECVARAPERHLAADRSISELIFDGNVSPAAAAV